MRAPSLLWVQIALALVIMIWGAAYPLIKALLARLSPMELMLARFWITCLALAGIAWRFRSDIVQLLRRHPLRLVCLALLGVPGYHLTLNIGTEILTADPLTHHSAAMLASILVATVPAWTALFAHLIRLERLSRRQWLGQLLAFAGVILIVSRGEFGTLRLTTGALWVLGAPVSWALYSVIARPLLARSASSLPLISFVVLLGTLVMTPFTPSGALSRLAALDTAAWGQLLFVALLSTFVGYLVWALAIQRMEATRASAYIYFIPFFSMLVAILFFDERLSTLVILGGALILGGVLLIQLGKIRGEPPGDLPSHGSSR